MENEVDVKAGIQRARHVGKRAFVHFLHLLDLGAFLLNVGLEALDYLVHRILPALGVEHEQRFVTILHDSSDLLNLFIAETKPLSIAHFTASAAHSMIEVTSGFSSS